MSLAKISQIAGPGVYVPGDDVDTDRVIPARYMKCITFDGLGEYVFYDERFDANGQPKPHPINDPKYAGATILLAGRNFGCGSSREHAPQALYRHGFRAILAESFAEIFFGNSITLGMPCLVMDGRDIRALAALIEEARQVGCHRRPSRRPRRRQVYRCRTALHSSGLTWNSIRALLASWRLGEIATALRPYFSFPPRALFLTLPECSS